MTPSPFDDADFRAQLAAMGVTHQPGLADAMLNEIAPLLKADGIDLNELDVSDLDAVNEALARATARQNFELFTPVGPLRAASLETLRAFALALLAGDVTGARRIAGSIGPDPADGRPAGSHVIGVSLGLLDGWGTDPATRDLLATVRPPHWHRKPSRKAAADELALAREGRAFDALDELHRTHTGQSIFEGGMLAVAAAVDAFAAEEGVDVSVVADRLLTRAADAAGTTSTTNGRDRIRTDVPRPGTFGSGSAFVRPVPGSSAGPSPAARRGGKGKGVSGNPARRGGELADRRMLRDFGRWIREDDEVSASEAAVTVGNLEQVSTNAGRIGLDIADPADMERIVEMVVFAAERLDEEEFLLACLGALDEYVHFRIETGDALSWESADRIVEEALDEHDERDPLTSIILESESIPEADRIAAALDTPLAHGVSGVLEWIGAGRPTTQTGAVRRADIQAFASFLGIDAVGVAKRTASSVEGPVQAQTMDDVPALRAWWESLQLIDAIELTATRVRPGPLAHEWTAGAVPPFDSVEKLVGMFLIEHLTGDGSQVSLIDDEVIRELLMMLVPEMEDAFINDPRRPSWVPLIHRRLQGLSNLGLLVPGEEGTFSIPAPLRGIMARGILATMTVIAAMKELDE
ncbi:MAG: hypothetical protein JST33_10350 [Actinobacteria bacterium]|nr:hypothetical protein [Actinomycetota bacterium]